MTSQKIKTQSIEKYGSSNHQNSKYDSISTHERSMHKSNNPRPKSHSNKYKDEFKQLKRAYTHLQKTYEDEKSRLDQVIKDKNERIRVLEGGKQRVKMDFDTLTTINDVPSLKQEIDDLHLMIDELEAQRDQANDQVASLKSELAATQDILQKNQLNLIEPLQNKIQELEKIVDENEADIKKRYKRKLRKYKREIEVQNRTI